MNANRRLQERKQPEPMVFCKLGGEESGSVLNLSEDGVCFESLASMASVAEPVSASALISEPTATRPLAQAISVAAPTGSARRQSPGRAGAFSTDLMTRTLSPSPTKQPAKAEPLGATPAAVVPASAASKVHS